jgi:hypothetical protein
MIGLSGPLILVADPALGHAFGRPYDLPIPLSFYLGAAGAVVVLSFVIAAVALRWHVPVADPPERITPLPRPMIWICQTAYLVVFLLVITAGLLGSQNTFKNIAPLTVWVVFWAGQSLVCGFLGDFWPVLNPLATVYGWVEKLCGRARPGLSLNLPLPRWLGAWPAVGLFLGFAWCELLWEGSGHPRDIAVLLIAYSGLTWLSMALFGRSVWLRTGEIFSVAFAQFGCFAPIALRQANGHFQVGWRVLGVGLLRDLPYTPSRAAFLVVMLATVTFDGLSETPAWRDLLRALRPDRDNAATIATAGLVLLPVIFTAALAMTMWLCRRLALSRQSLIVLTGCFVPSLLPIALAYQLAHNLSFLLLGVQYMVPLVSDPFGFGWNIFDTTLYIVDPSLVSAKMLWTVAVVAIVAGHAAAVYLSHVVALRVFDRNLATRSQLPMLVLMVAYTMTSLWILAQPITNARTGG